MSSGEVGLPMLGLSSTSEDTGAVVTSSPKLHTEQKLALLDRCFQQRRWAHNLQEDTVRPVDQTVLLCVYRVVVPRFLKIFESDTTAVQTRAAKDTGA